MDITDGLYILAKRVSPSEKLSSFRLCGPDLAARASAALRIDASGLEIRKAPEGWYQADCDLSLSEIGYQAYVREDWEFRRAPELERPRDGVIDLKESMLAMGYKPLYRNIMREDGYAVHRQSSWFTPMAYDRQIEAWIAGDQDARRENDLYRALIGTDG